MRSENNISKDALQDLNFLLNNEWVLRNIFGTYSSSTLAMVNTRREHGLLAVPDRQSRESIVALSRIDESVFIDAQHHELNFKPFVGNTYPVHNPYLQSISADPFRKYTYLIDGYRLEKTILLHSERNLLILHYELKNRKRPVKIVLKPFLAERYNTELSHEIQGLNTDSYQGQNFVRWSPKPHMPELNVCYNNGEYIAATLWYHSFIYPRDQHQDGENREDLLNPGFFQAILEPYAHLDLFISSDPLNTSDCNFEEFYRLESEKINEKQSRSFSRFYFDLRLSDSIHRRNSHFEAAPSAYSLKQRTQDILLSLPGLTLPQQNFELFKTYLQWMFEQLDHGLLPTTLENETRNRRFRNVDLALWLIDRLYLYYERTKDLPTVAVHFDACQVIIDSYVRGMGSRVRADKDELLITGDRMNNLSWIPLKKANGDVLRHGKLLETNALWYNAVRITAYFAGLLKKGRIEGKLQKKAGKIELSFQNVFFSEEKQQLIDFALYDQKNYDLRINQILPVALPFCPLKPKQAIVIFDLVNTELVTPYGLRAKSQSRTTPKKDPDVPLNRYTAAFYETAIWPWTIGLYIQAILKIKSPGEVDSDILNTFFKPLISLDQSYLIGAYPEAVVAGQNIEQHGVQAYLPSLANLMWAEYLLKKK